MLTPRPDRDVPVRSARRRTLIKTLAIWPCAFGTSIALPTFAADAYPSKPIRLIVPFAAGGGGDILARLVMTRVGKELGQIMVVENIAGAGGNIGSKTAARAPADGYTVLYGTNGTHAINQTLYRDPGFNAEKDFNAVSQLTTIAAMMVVRPGFPAKSMKELLAVVKASPDKYTFASAGNGTTSHLAGELLKSTAGLSLVHVPYRGGALAMTDLIAGQVDMMMDVMPNTSPQVKAGRVQALAVTTAERVGSFPDLPTVAESGVPGFEVSAWDAIFVPAGTPIAVITRLNEAVAKALKDPELIAQLRERGAEVAPSTPDALHKHVSSEIRRWGDVVKRAGATVD